MKPAVWLIAFVVAAPAAGVDAQSRVPASKARAHVETLAAERLEGRLAGSPGERLASEYIISQLKRIGARPLPGRTDYRLPFEFTAGTRDGGTTDRDLQQPAGGRETLARFRRGWTFRRSRSRTTAR